MADVQYPEDQQVETERNAQQDGELGVILHILLTFFTLLIDILHADASLICRIVVYLCYSLLVLHSDPGRVIIRLTDFS